MSQESIHRFHNRDIYATLGCGCRDTKARTAKYCVHIIHYPLKDRRSLRQLVIFKPIHHIHGRTKEVIHIVTVVRYWTEMEGEAAQDRLAIAHPDSGDAKRCGFPEFLAGGKFF